MKNYNYKRNQFLDAFPAKISFLFWVFSLSTFLTFAKNKPKIQNEAKTTITGTVSDKTGPLLGVNILVKGTSIGTLTDFDGNYSIEVENASSATLVFSYVGYKSKEIVIGNQKNINVELEQETSELEEVVLLGYTSRKKGELTGSVTTIKEDVIEKSSSKDIAKSLAGRASGLIINDRGGYPGANGGTSILIRGLSTTGNNAPLILIDGIQAGSFSHLSPQDIASLTVLKDGAAAIYGSRAANGVILITTKRGKQGGPKINFTTSYSSSTFSRTPSLMSSEQYAIYENEIAERIGQPLPFTNEQIAAYKAGNDPLNFPNTDWSSLTLADNTPESRTSLSISGGDEKTKYFVSGDIFDQQGLYRSGDLGFKQKQIRSNIDIKVFDKLKIGVDLLGRFGNRKEPGVDDGFIYKHIYTNLPTEVAVYPNGLPGFGGENGANPIVMSSSESGYVKRKDNDLRGKFSYDLNLDKIAQGLSIKGFAGIRKMSNDEKSWYTPWTYYSLQGVDDYVPQTGFSQRGQQRILRNSFWKYDETLLNSTIHYSNSINDHQFSGFVGVESLTSNTSSFWAQRIGAFPTSTSTELPFGDQEQQSTSSQSTEFARLDYFGSFSYNYAKKYYVDLTLRRDGSSNFYSGNRYGTFPSVAVGWDITKESFLDDVKNLDQLKLRASWSIMGNDRIAPFQWSSGYISGNTNLNTALPRYYVFGTSGSLVNAFGLPVLANRDVTWETAYMKNLGVNVTLFNKRFNADLNYFHQNREDILRQNTDGLPAISGIASSQIPDTNLAKTKSWGYEFEMSWNDQVGEVTYNIGMNYSLAKNEVLDINEADGVPSYQKQEGKPINSFLVYPTNGIFKDQAEVDATEVKLENTVEGEPIYVDTNGDGKITGADRIRVDETNIPQVQYGIYGGLEYKKFEFNFLLQGQAGAKTLVFFDQVGAKPDFVFHNRWTPDNRNASYPRAFGQGDPFSGNQSGDVANFEGADIYLKDASFLRLKEIELAYTFTKEKLKFGNIRVFARGFNLLTMFSDIYDLGLDPEATSFNNFREATYPSLKTYTVGVNVNF
ncbi:SusC/RagA family TonB-linked outer membrane protein [Ochrovirga pacifica]|uniref:SusC/RagA family TonB-linked outer membrane protein n=1 Tax=Ochrovirga pacifica TaxID=1042376 RepID=UPI000255981F|nr:TonB-dependent receptor [Ochrovirga pacifica]